MKNYLVIGGNSGIGKAIAMNLASQDEKVVIVGRDKTKLEAVSREDENIIPYSYDLTNLEEINKIFDFCKEQGIKLDGLIYAAGLAKNVPLSMNDVTDMQEVFNVNCLAFAEMMKYFSKKKYANEGASVVAISSIGATLCLKGRAVYAASKSALNSIVKVAAKELAKKKIRVNAVLPGFVNTEMTEKLFENTENLDEIINSEQPWGLIEPEQVSDLVSFLMSDQAQMITGTLIPITGGRVL